MKPTKSEAKCKDMADVCELAHKRTVRECKRIGILVDCVSSMMCGDNSRHIMDGQDDDVHYTTESQEVFDKHYDYICSVTGL